MYSRDIFVYLTFVIVTRTNSNVYVYGHAHTRGLRKTREAAAPRKRKTLRIGSHNNAVSHTFAPTPSPPCNTIYIAIPTLNENPRFRHLPFHSLFFKFHSSIVFFRSFLSQNFRVTRNREFYHFLHVHGRPYKHTHTRSHSHTLATSLFFFDFIRGVRNFQLFIDFGPTFENFVIIHQTFRF